MATQTLVRPAPSAAREQRLPSVRVAMAPRTTTFRVAEVRVRSAAPAERRVGETAALRSPRSTPTPTGRPVEARPAVARPAVAGPTVRSRPAAVRLTRRGRLAILGTLAVLALLVFALVQAGMPALAGTAGEGPATRTVVVEPGQTLWQIARDIRPQADPRETVARIQELNGLTTVTVWAGQPLVVPA